MKPSKTTCFLGCVIGGMGAAMLPLLLNSSHADTKLLPFQGRLTDAFGSAVADGAKVVEFKIYDAPTGGNVKWAGEVHKLSVNGGLVNTMLGSKAALGSVDFSTPSFLQITVDANGDGQITAADPPLLPRQSVVSAVYANEAGNARDSVKLAGSDWSSIIVDGIGNPSNTPGNGFVKGAKLQPGGITGTQLAVNSVDTTKIVDGSVGNGDLGPNAVTTDKILDGTILPQDLSSGLQTSLVLTGTVVSYAAASVPANSGWLLCDGRAVSKTTYAGLFAVIGSTHGTGDGSGTTFSLPDYRGRFLRGVDDPDGPGGLAAAGRDLDVSGRTHMSTGVVVGGVVGSVQGDAFASHTHTMKYRNWNNANSDTPGSNALSSGATGVTTISDVETQAKGGSETRPKNVSVNYIIKY